MKIEVDHPNIGEPKTYLSAPLQADQSGCEVINTAGFAADDYLVKGNPQSDDAEILQIEEVTDSNTLAFVINNIFASPLNTPLTLIAYNQIRYYLGDWSARYQTGTISVTKNSPIVTGSGVNWTGLTVTSKLFLNGKWYDIRSFDSAGQLTLTENYADETLVSNSYSLVSFTLQDTVDIAIDQKKTIWDDPNAQAEDFYYTDYYNETTAAFSSRSGIMAVFEETGYSEYALRTIEDEVLTELRDKGGKRLTRPEVDTAVNNAIRELINAIVSFVDGDYLNSYDTIDFKSGKSEYPLFKDFKKMTAIWISQDGVNYYKATPMRISQEYPDVQYIDSEPHYYLRDNVIGIRPVPARDVTMGAKVWYDRRIPALKKENDELPFVLQDYKRLIVAYCLDKGSISEDDGGKSSRYFVEFSTGKTNMIAELASRDTSNPKSIEITNDYDLYE